MSDFIFQVEALSAANLAIAKRNEMLEKENQGLRERIRELIESRNDKVQCVKAELAKDLQRAQQALRVAYDELHIARETSVRLEDASCSRKCPFRRKVLR